MRRNSLNVSRLEFGSFLAYLPPADPRFNDTTFAKEAKLANDAKYIIKNDSFVSQPPILMSRFISNRIKKRMGILPFSHFFDKNPVLIPIPNSSFMKPNTLWVPQRLANALYENGLGRGIEDVLKRKIALPKAATSPAKDRPKAWQHYQSLEIQKTLSEPKEILLIDDVVTRGATLLGATNKLSDTFPGVRIKAFSVMRTIGKRGPFRGVYDPVVGEIELNGQETFRNP